MGAGRVVGCRLSSQRTEVLGEQGQGGIHSRLDCGGRASFWSSHVVVLTASRPLWSSDQASASYGRAQRRNTRDRVVPERESESHDRRNTLLQGTDTRATCVHGQIRGRGFFLAMEDTWRGLSSHSGVCFVFAMLVSPTFSLIGLVFGVGIPRRLHRNPSLVCHRLGMIAPM
jgi:hypothetical protein